MNGKDQKVFTTSGTYPWSFLTQMFRKGLPRHDGGRKTVEVMTSIEPIGTLGSVATLYQGNPDMSHGL